MKTDGRIRIDWLATAAVIGSLCCWSTGPIFIKYLTGYIDFWTQNFLRYSTACIFWLPFLMYSVCKGKVSRKTWRVALLPAAANVIMQCFWAASLYYIEPAFMNLLVRSSFIWIAVFSIVFFDEERPLVGSKRFWLGLTLSVVGVCGVLACKEGFAEIKTITGIIFALLAAFLWAVYTLTVRMAFKKAVTDPLPLVPATWITGASRSCGSPKARKSRRIRSSDKSIASGCSDFKRCRMSVLLSMHTRPQLHDARSIPRC